MVSFKVCANCGFQANPRKHICPRCFPPGEYRQELRERARCAGRRLTLTVWRHPTGAEVHEAQGKSERMEALLQELLRPYPEEESA